MDRLPNRNHRRRGRCTPPALGSPVLLAVVASVLAMAGCGAPTASVPRPPPTSLRTTNPGPARSSPGSVSPASGATTAPSRALSLITEPEDGYRSIDQLIAGARDTVDLTMYELADDQTQGLLVSALQRGVSVRVLLDGSPSGTSVNQAATSQLEAAGLPVRRGPEGVIFHQKTLTVDGTVSAVMTGNLTSRYYGTTRDFVVIDRDPAAVSAIESVFANDWNGSRVAAGPGAGGLVWSPGRNRLSSTSSTLPGTL